MAGTPFDWEFPYRSQRMPVLARNVVATSQPLAAQAGLAMLHAGGNAADAAIAAAIALTVVEPTSNGIGGDAFALVWDGTRLHGLNASGRSPATWTPERFREVPVRGWEAVTVPGAVSAWCALSEKFGRLPFARLFEPAVRYAGEGFLVSPITATGWARAEKAFGQLPAFRATFLPNGRAPAAGEVFACPEQARTLEAIAETRGEAFYRGALAERIAADAAAHGAALSVDDLASHTADWVEPIAADYRGFGVHELPPNGQGLAALLALAILQRLGVAEHAPDSAGALHLQIEATKLALRDAHRYVTDGRFMDVRVADLLDPGYVEQRAAVVDRTRASDPGHGAPRPGGTVYLAAADASGMMVSFIQSNYMGFGSGIVVPGTGIALQNRAAGFVSDPAHPNRIDGGKRPFHTIIPAFVTEDGAPRMAFGVMGGPMQAQGHVQMIVRIRDHRQNPQAACDAPRWQVAAGRELMVESGFAPDVLDDLRARGHHVVERHPANFGGAQLVWKLDHGYLAASDPRKDGQAVGF
jgi:gamma-glutamyltranspeptidase/glutathione hydrolase